MRNSLHSYVMPCCFYLLLTASVAPKNLHANTYQYCIIVDDDLADILQTLSDWKNQKGVSSTIATTGWIEQNYSGRDKAEKIRNFVVEKIEEWPDFTYLLLAGDVGTIPPRYVLTRATSGETISVPSDEYYTLLSSNWDTNDDGIFTEREIDFDDYGLYVGRLPSDDRMDMTTMVNKIITYEQELPIGSWKKQIIFCAGILDLGRGVDCVQTSEDLYHRDFPQNMGFQRYYLYESVTQNFDDLSVENFMFVLNRGATILNIISHGDIENFYWFKKDDDKWYPGDHLTTDHIESAQNGFKLPMVMACACETAHFDHYVKCLGESFMTAPNGGAIIYFGGVRYGIIQTYFFYPDFFGQAYQRAGVAWQMAKRRAMQEVVDPYWRFGYLQAIMFGDPELRIRFSDITRVEEETYSPVAAITASPNPFNASTAIAFDLPESGRVNLTVYNIFGQEVETLIDAHYEAGYHRTVWNAADKAGGLYFYRIQSAHFSQVNKLILIK